MRKWSIKCLLVILSAFPLRETDFEKESNLPTISQLVKHVTSPATAVKNWATRAGLPHSATFVACGLSYDFLPVFGG